jgi:hypothetical protein
MKISDAVHPGQRDPHLLLAVIIALFGGYLNAS